MQSETLPDAAWPDRDLWALEVATRYVSLAYRAWSTYGWSAFVAHGHDKRALGVALRAPSGIWTWETLEHAQAVLRGERRLSPAMCAVPMTFARLCDVHRVTHVSCSGTLVRIGVAE